MQPIIIDESWDQKLQEIAEKFNKYVKKHSMRLTSFYLDKAFDLMADDESEVQYDAAQFLKRVRALNPKLISSYMNALIDAKIERDILSQKQYVVPDYSQYPVSQDLQETVINAVIPNDNEGQSDQPVTDDSNYSEIEQDKNESEDDAIIISEENDSSQKQNIEITAESSPNTNKNEAGIAESPHQVNNQETDEQQSDSNILTWDLKQLIEFRIVTNLEKILYENIESPIKKCAMGDGIFEKHEDSIWQCKKCKTAYHENCAKITAVFEGKCRICDAPFYIEDKKKEKSQEPNNKK